KLPWYLERYTTATQQHDFEESDKHVMITKAGWYPFKLNAGGKPDLDVHGNEKCIPGVSEWFGSQEITVTSSAFVNFPTEKDPNIDSIDTPHPLIIILQKGIPRDLRKQKETVEDV